MREVQLHWRPWRLHKGDLAPMARVFSEVIIEAVTCQHSDACTQLASVVLAPGHTEDDISAIALLDDVRILEAATEVGGVARVIWTNRHPLFQIDKQLDEVALQPPLTIDGSGMIATLRGTPAGVMAFLQEARAHLAPDRVSVLNAPVSLPSSDADVSDRQMEIVNAAIEAGYYDIPRRVSLRELAAQLGASRSTIGEHLQRAEAVLMHRLVEGGL